MAAETKEIAVMQLSRWISSQGGGIQAYLRSLTSALKGQSVDLSYAAFLDGDTPEYVTGPVRLGKARSKFTNAIALWKWLNASLRDVDLLHIHGVTDWHFVIGAVLCLKKGKPYVVSIHGGLLPGAIAQIQRLPWLTVPIMKYVARILLLRAQTVLVTSEQEMKSIEQLDKRIPVSCVLPGVSVPSRPRAVGHYDLSSTYNISYIGRIEPVKSLPTLFYALSKLKSKGRHFRVHIIGDGRAFYKDTLRSLAESLELCDEIVWHGYKTLLSRDKLLHSSQVLVLPSLSENFGFVVAEAMAQSVPVIVSDGVGLAPLVNRSESGLVFHVNDVDDLAAKLLTLTEPSTQARYSARAHLTAKSELSLESMGCSLFRIYIEALGR